MQIPHTSYELTETFSLAISPRFFHFKSKLKTLLFSKSYPGSSSSRTSLPVSTPNTIHHIAVWLSAFLTLWILTAAVPIDFVFVKLVPATSLLWALYKSKVYDYGYDSHTWIEHKWRPKFFKSYRGS